MKTVVCLQVVLLNKEELENLMEIGPMLFSDYLYPEDGSNAYFLTERHRSKKFWLFIGYYVVLRWIISRVWY